jgi:hypothetical protein
MAFQTKHIEAFKKSIAVGLKKAKQRRNDFSTLEQIVGEVIKACSESFPELIFSGNIKIGGVYTMTVKTSDSPFNTIFELHYNCEPSGPFPIGLYRIDFEAIKGSSQLKSFNQLRQALQCFFESSTFGQDCLTLINGGEK